MKEEAKTVLDSMSVLLRYIASGFIGLLVYMFLFGLNDKEISKDSWFLVIVAASIGLLTYGFHVAWIDKLFYKFHLHAIFKQHRKKNMIPEKIKKAITTSLKFKHEGGFNANNVTCEDLQFAFFSQSYLRNTSDNGRIGRLQNFLEKRMALLSFLYGIIYQTTIVLLYFLADRLFLNNAQFTRVDLLKGPVVFVGLVVLCFCTSMFDRRICKREFWVIEHFYQE